MPPPTFDTVFGKTPRVAALQCLVVDASFGMAGLAFETAGFSAISQGNGRKTREVEALALEA